MEQEEKIKNEEYTNYINTHIKNVELMFNKYFIPLLNKENISSKIDDKILKETISNMGEQIKKHDSSKFSKEEFIFYRKKFYPTSFEKNNIDMQKQINKDFKNAWKHHYKNNPHHPFYWIEENGNIKNMSLNYIIEMICDWFAMSFYFKSNFKKWFDNAVKEKNSMNDYTKELVNEILFNILKI